MGYSTPKTPFDLAEFLSQKAKPGAGRKPSWRRLAPRRPSAIGEVAAAAGQDQSTKKAPARSETRLVEQE